MTGPPVQSSQDVADIKPACTFAQAAAALFVAATPQEQAELSADRVQAFLERAR